MEKVSYHFATLPILKIHDINELVQARAGIDISSRLRINRNLRDINYVLIDEDL
jgi:hypothetical protein